MAATTPSRRKQHKPSASLGSLYEVLADLDETQLQYLIQEMNHTGHQNVPVSQAVSAFESDNPTDSLNTVRASMLPSPQAMQRQLSKSQRGKLRLHTAFQRAPSLRQRQRQENHGAAEPAQNAAPETPKQQPTRGPADMLAALSRSPPSPVVVRDEAQQPMIRSRRRRNESDTISPTRHVEGPRKSPAYKRISRPDFSLPPGVTVIDLLQLLEVEFLSSSSQDPSFPSSISSPTSPHLSQSPRQLSSSSYMLSPATPGSAGPRSLRRHASRLDIALDAERSASGAEEIGLGMLEPRPSRTVSLGTTGVSPSMGSSDVFGSRLRGETPPPPPPVLEGIFDVLKNQ